MLTVNINKIIIKIAENRLIAVFIFALSIMFVSYFLLCMYQLIQPVPLSDHMDIVMNVLKWSGNIPGQNISLPGLVFHNEHPIAITDLFVLLDVLLFHSSGLFLIVVSLVSQGIHTSIMLGNARHFSFSSNAFLLLVSIVIIFMFSGANIDNFLWGSQVQFIQVYMFASAAFVSFSIGMFRNSRWWLAMAIFTAICSALSMANGLLVMPMLMVVSFMLWFDNRQLSGLIVALVFALLTFISFVLYFVFGPSGVGHETSFNISEFIKFIFCYLAGPSHQHGEILGALGVVLAVWFTLTAIRRLHELPAARLSLILILDFILLSAIATALGRTGIAPRYNTPALVFWSAILILCAADFKVSHYVARYLARIGLIACLLIVVATVRDQFGEIARWRTDTDQFRIANAAMASNVEDVMSFRRVYPWDGRVQEFTPIARRLHLSTFATSLPKAIGRQVSPALVDRLPDCSGIITGIWPRRLMEKSVASDASGVRVNGRISPRLVSRFHLRDLAVVNASSVIIGLGYVAQYSHMIGHWSAFASSADFNKAVSILGIAKGGGAPICRVGSAGLQSAIPEHFVAFSRLHRLISPLPITTSGNGWSANGVNKSVGLKPIPGKQWGSGGANGMDDAATGILTMGPLYLPNHSSALALPLVTGPSIRGLRLQVLVANNGAIIHTVDLGYASLQHWSVVQIKVPAYARKVGVVIKAVDNGTGWGQWMGIGEPYALP